MIAVDTSTLVAYFHGESGEDVEALDAALEAGNIILPVVVLTEILSDPKLPASIEGWLKEIPRTVIHDGFWERAAALRKKILSNGLKSRLADAYIAQLCVDNKVSLITRDKDFRHYSKAAGLDLVTN